MGKREGNGLAKAPAPFILDGGRILRSHAISSRRGLSCQYLGPATTSRDSAATTAASARRRHDITNNEQFTRWASVGAQRAAPLSRAWHSRGSNQASISGRHPERGFVDAVDKGIGTSKRPRNNGLSFSNELLRCKAPRTPGSPRATRRPEGPKNRQRRRGAFSLPAVVILSGNHILRCQIASPRRDLSP